MFAPSTMEAIAPSAQDTRIARESSIALAPLLSEMDNGLSSVLRCAEGGHESEIAIPSSMLPFLLNALQELAKGNTITLLPVQTELTTQQAAELMRVSRPSLIKMLDEGKLPYRKIGAHRRVRYDDVMRYVQAEHARRVKVMEELIAETESLGLYE